MARDRPLDEFLDREDQESGEDEPPEADADRPSKDADRPPADDQPSGEDADRPTADPESADDEARDTPVGSADGDTPVDGTRPTYAWTPGGDDCEQCGATVERRWHDGDAMVCAECKDW